LERLETDQFPQSLKAMARFRVTKTITEINAILEFIGAALIKCVFAGK
jgi:hypothetical protein